MPALFTDTQNELADVARTIGAEGITMQRDVLNGGDVPAEPTRALLEGYSGVGAPEAQGGFGGSLVDLVVFLESLFRGALPTPFGTHVAAVQAAVGAGIDVSAAVSGGELWTLAAVERMGQRWGDWSMSIDASGVTGAKVGVPFGAVADKVVVIGADDRVALVNVASSRPRTGMDPALRPADIEIKGAPIASALGGSRAFLRAGVVLAAQTVGVARGALELASSYAAARKQFDQAIGSFQGVAHPLADALVDLEAAWSLVLYAAWALDESADDAVIASHVAIARAGSAAIAVTERALQVHGGIGVTWEADPHLYIRRVLALNGLLGGHAAHFRMAGAEAVRWGIR